MDNVDALNIFAFVGELGSISAAARAMGLPKARVSRAVQRLEEVHGVQLIERTTRSVALTEVGRILHARSLRLREEMAEADAEIAAYRGEPKGTLRVGCPGDTSRSLLTPHLHEFLDRYPEIDLRVRVGERLLPESNGLDVVIHSGWLSDSRLTARKIADVRMVLVASAEYVSAHGLPMTPEEMIDHRLIGNFYLDSAALEAGPLPAHVPMLEVVKGDQRCRLPTWSRFSSTDHEQIFELVKHGKAIAQMPAVTAMSGLVSGQLKRVLPGYEILNPPSLYALYLQRAALVPKLRVFLEFIAGIAERQLRDFDSSRADSARILDL